MKLISRLFIIKKIFLFFNRINLKKKNLKYEINEDEVILISNNSSINQILNDLHEDGISKSLKINKNSLNKIKDYVDNNLCYAYGETQNGFYFNERKECEAKINREILLSKYFNFQKEEPFAAISNSSLLQAIANNYLGKNATNIATQLWWTFPANVDLQTRSEAAHNFHRDVDGWGFVKFFFYLSDVTEGGGPHVYVKKSHKPSFINQLFSEKLLIGRHSDGAIKNRFDTNAICEIYGTAGKGFAADTYGFHKGVSPIKNPRLVLCCVYATKDYGVQEFTKKPELLSHFKN